MEDAHEGLFAFCQLGGWEKDGVRVCYSDDDPDDGRGEEDLDRAFDVGDAEHAPVEAEDGCFAEE